MTTTKWLEPWPDQITDVLGIIEYLAAFIQSPEPLQHARDRSLLEMTPYHDRITGEVLTWES
jgi:hypothetical protein